MQIFNAIKYSTAFPVIIFSAMKYQVYIPDPGPAALHGRDTPTRFLFKMKCFCQYSLNTPTCYSTLKPQRSMLWNAARMLRQVAPEQWVGLYKPLWLGAALLNSSYSYYWDIERDWDIQWFTAPGARCLELLKIS